ncbi:MAG: hypothetical protein HC767_01490 [Akkermansiaceae bacterium]|nr:hypothetical protein [Akkermansiaceae bacterium]
MNPFASSATARADYTCSIAYETRAMARCAASVGERRTDHYRNGHSKAIVDTPAAAGRHKRASCPNA